jgi:hypothetical protein
MADFMSSLIRSFKLLIHPKNALKQKENVLPSAKTRLGSDLKRVFARRTE